MKFRISSFGKRGERGGGTDCLRCCSLSCALSSTTLTANCLSVNYHIFSSHKMLPARSLALQTSPHTQCLARPRDQLARPALSPCRVQYPLLALLPRTRSVALLVSLCLLPRQLFPRPLTPPRLLLAFVARLLTALLLLARRPLLLLLRVLLPRPLCLLLSRLLPPPLLLLRLLLARPLLHQHPLHPLSLLSNSTNTAVCTALANEPPLT